MESTFVDSSETRLTQPGIDESQMETVDQLTGKGTRGRAELRKLRLGQGQKTPGITSQCTKNKANTTSSRGKLNLCHDGNEGDVVVGTSQKGQVVDPKNKNKKGGSQLKNLRTPIASTSSTRITSPNANSSRDERTKKTKKSKNGAADLFATKSITKLTKTMKESNPTHSASSSIDKNEYEATSDRTSGTTTTDNTTGIGKTRSNKFFITNPAPNDESLPLECRFCGYESLFMKLGGLFGPYYENRNQVTIGKTKTEIWLHQSCALWTPGVRLVGDSALGLDSAVFKADKQICQFCDRSGATIGCFSENCTAYVHFLCGKMNNWKLDYKTFRSHCGQHNKEQ